MPDSVIVPTRDLFTAHELKTSPVYNEFLRESYQASLNVRLDGSDGSSIYWTLADPTHGNGWGTEQVELIEHLLPHIRQFVRVRQALAGKGLLGLSLMKLLDNARVGIIQLDINGRIRVANGRAVDILREGDGLSDERGFLRARLPADNSRLKNLLAGALPAFGDPPVSGSMTIRRSSGKRRLVLHVIPNAGGQADEYHRFAGPLVEIIEPGNHAGIEPGLVGVALGITSRDCCGKPGSRHVGGRQSRSRHCCGNALPREHRPLPHKADAPETGYLEACGIGTAGDITGR